MVSVLGYKSRAFKVTSGVPQGSHLGPLFFIIYINNIKSCFKHCNVLLYADDLKIYRGVKSADDCIKIQQDIARLEKFCMDNQMFLNPSKCFHMSFTKNSNKINHTYKINNINIKSVTHMKDLGVTFDEKLSFKIHVERTINTANRMVGFVNRYSRDFRDPRTLIALYYAFIHSRISFASIIWNPQYAIYVNRIESVQNKFLRFLAFKMRAAETEQRDYNQIRSRFKIIRLEDRRTVSDLCMLYKILHSTIDSPYLLSQLNLRIPSRTIRNTNLFDIPYRRTNTGQHSPLIRMQNSFNELSSRVDIDIFSLSFLKFKKIMRAFFL